MQYFVMFSMGFNSVMAINIGRNIGAGRVAEAKFYYRLIRLIVVMYALCMAMVFFFFNDVLFNLFTDDDTVMETLSITYYVITILMIFNIATRAGMGAIRSLGIQMQILKYSVFVMWVLQPVLAYTLAISLDTGYFGIKSA